MKEAGEVMRTNEQPVLYLWGLVRLAHEGKIVRLRRKGLAILCYLALEGPTHREKLASLLWDQFSAAKNLRVELHDLREAFSALGYRIFADRENLLSLPSFISLDKISGADQNNLPMEGLDDLSSEYQQWLERQRHGLFSLEVLREVHEDLVQEIAEDLHPPFVLIVQPLPGATSLAFAVALARALRLPLREHVEDDNHAVYYLCPPHYDNALPKILASHKGIYVVERPPFGQDPELVLRLRGHYPAKHLHYIVLPPLSWSEVRAGELHDMPFGEAAKLYLTSHGHPTYLHELCSLRPKGTSKHVLPLPQKMRALIEIETRRLGVAARHALERCSVHPGPLSNEMISAFDLAPYLEELEEQGWLSFHAGERVWTFSEDFVRKVIYQSLKSGQQQYYHQVAASRLALEGERIAEVYHEIMAEGKSAAEGKALVEKLVPLEGLPGWSSFALSAWLEHASAPSPPQQEVAFCGHELAILETFRFGSRLEAQGSGCLWARFPLDLMASGFSWSLPEDTCLLRLRGHAFVDNLFGIGLDGQAVPLELELEGQTVSHVVLASVPEASLTEDHELVLPLSESFEHWLYLSNKRTLTIQSRAELALINLEIRAFSVVSSPLHRNLAATQAHNLAALETVQG